MAGKVKIFIGADHRGFKLKSELLPVLNSCHDFVEAEDKGTSSKEACDFNDPAKAVAKAVKETPHSFGILICGSAHGMCIQANRFKGIRAINAGSPELAKLGREHNDANILCLPADFVDLEASKKIIYEFFHTKFDKSEKRLRRIKKLDEGEYGD